MKFTTVVKRLSAGVARRQAHATQATATHATAPGPATAAAGIGIADELVKLAALKDSGVLTDQEFAVQKAKLLGASEGLG